MATEPEPRAGCLMTLFSGVRDFVRLLFKLPLRALRAMFKVTRVIAAKYRRAPRVHRGYDSIPTLPFRLRDMLTTAARLAIRLQQTTQAKQGLTHVYTLRGRSATGFELLYGRGEKSPKDHTLESLIEELEEDIEDLETEMEDLIEDHWHEHHDQEVTTAPEGALPRALSLEDPSQWAMAWTTFPEVHQHATPEPLETYVASLTDAEEATRQFWPTLATHGLAYNLLIAQKVTRPERALELKKKLESAWTPSVEDAFQAGRLYAIDLSIFKTLEDGKVHGKMRFTPATLTLLTQDASKDLTPVAIRVSDRGEEQVQIYQQGDPAWIYALQAAKVSITVYGIWLGHVYHWHIVTAAMQMPMLNHLPADHAVHQLLEPQARSLIGFDAVLLVGWDIAPPTSLNRAEQFVALCDEFAKHRGFFDDDPKTALANLGISQEDFTEEGKEAWNKFPLVADLLEVWDATQAYIEVFVNVTYHHAKVSDDKALQKWIRRASRKRGGLATDRQRDNGNVRGLPKLNSKDDDENKKKLKRLLTSLTFRSIIHGTSRLNRAANPALTFVANFPPCLQNDQLPDPGTAIDTQTLLTYLPDTETIGEMLDFYFAFIFSPPYEPFVPLAGIEEEPYFTHDKNVDPENRRNRALFEYRAAMLEVIKRLDPKTLQRFQLPIGIEI